MDPFVQFCLTIFFCFMIYFLYSWVAYFFQKYHLFERLAVVFKMRTEYSVATLVHVEIALGYYFDLISLDGHKIRSFSPDDSIETISKWAFKHGYCVIDNRK